MINESFECDLDWGVRDRFCDWLLRALAVFVGVRNGHIDGICGGRLRVLPWNYLCAPGFSIVERTNVIMTAYISLSSFVSPQEEAMKYRLFAVALLGCGLFTQSAEAGNYCHTTCYQPCHTTCYQPCHVTHYQPCHVQHCQPCHVQHCQPCRVTCYRACRVSCCQPCRVTYCQPRCGSCHNYCGGHCQQTHCGQSCWYHTSVCGR